MTPSSVPQLPRALGRVALLGGWLALAAACAGGGANDAAACADPTPDEVLASAVGSYLDGRQPRPLRFLNAAGTDSAMPEAGMRVMQSRGPTYLYPPDSAAQAKVRERLEEAAWPSLLVTYYGIERTGATETVVRLGGTWIGGELHGQSAGSEDVQLLCRTGRWVPADSVVPSASDAPAPRPSA